MAEVVVKHGRIPLEGIMDTLDIHEGDTLSLNVSGDLIMIAKKDEKVWDEARDFFTRITGSYKNLNYSPEGSPEYQRYRQEILELADKHSVAGETGS